MRQSHAFLNHRVEVAVALAAGGQRFILVERPIESSVFLVLGHSMLRGRRSTTGHYRRARCGPMRSLRRAASG